MRLRADKLACERGGRVVFRDLSFGLGAGELMLLTGPNGSGKSSLLRLVAGLNEAAAGRVALEGGGADEPVGQRCHLVAHQDALKPALTAMENLAFWAGLLGGGDTGAALAAFGLKRLAGYPAALLSAGQKRRLALARLLLAPRAVWLLDEPTVGLDTTSQQQLAAAMTAQLARGGMIIAASHVEIGLPPQQRLQLEAAS